MSHVVTAGDTASDGIVAVNGDASAAGARTSPIATTVHVVAPAAAAVRRPMSTSRNHGVVTTAVPPTAVAAVAPSSGVPADHVPDVSARTDHRNVGAPVVNRIWPPALIRRLLDRCPVLPGSPNTDPGIWHSGYVFSRLSSAVNVARFVDAP